MCNTLMAVIAVTASLLWSAPLLAGGPADVRILRDVDAECPRVTSQRELRNFNIVRMNRAVRVEVVEAALARHAARLGFNAIHSVSIVARPRKGVQASAVAALCDDAAAAGAGTAPGPAGIIAGAQTARLYRLDPMHALSAEPTAAQASKTLVRPLSPEALGQTKTLALDDASYEPPSPLVTACPFVPTTGIEFIAGTTSAWWLVALPDEKAGCGGAQVEAIVVDGQTNWRRVRTRVLTASSVTTLLALVR